MYWGPAVHGRGGQHHRDRGMQVPDQRIADRTDIAVGMGVRGRAVIEIQLSGTPRLQPPGSSNGMPYGFGCADRARFQGNNKGVDVW